MQQEEKTEEAAENQNAEPVEQCQDNVPQEDIGEGLDEIPEEEPAAGSVLYENDEPILVKGENVLSVFQTQFLNKLEKIQEEASREKPNWGYVKDHLQDLIRDINIQL